MNFDYIRDQRLCKGLISLRGLAIPVLALNKESDGLEVAFKALGRIRKKLLVAYSLACKLVSVVNYALIK